MKEGSLSRSPLGQKEEQPNAIALLGQAYGLLGLQIVEGVVGAGYPQKPSHSAVFAQIDKNSSRLTDLARCANIMPQAMAAATVRCAGARIAPASSTWAWPQTRRENGGAKAATTVIIATGRVGTLTPPGRAATSLPYRPKRHPIG